MIWMWILSVGLIGIAVIMCILQYVYVIFFHEVERDGGYTFVPLIFGFMIFVGVLMLPIDLPLNRFTLALIGTAIDPSSLMLFCLPFYLVGIGCKRVWTLINPR